MVITGTGKLEGTAFPIALTARTAYVTESPEDKVESEYDDKTSPGSEINGKKPAPLRSRNILNKYSLLNIIIVII